MKRLLLLAVVLVTARSAYAEINIGYTAKRGLPPLEKPEYIVAALVKSDAYFRKRGLERFFRVELME